MKTFDEKWEEIHKEQEWGKYPAEEVIRFVARNFYKSDRKDIKILDFGCGTGAVTWFIAREGFNAYGFDGSKTAIEKAKNRMRDEGVKAKLYVADAGNIPFESDYFDAIIDSAVIYANKINSIKNILNEINRVLKSGGKIMSTGLFNFKTSGYDTGKKIEEGTYRELKEGVLAHRGTVHFFSREEIQNIWEGAGFKNIKIDSVERTDMGGKYNVGFFIVEAEK